MNIRSSQSVATTISQIIVYKLIIYNAEPWMKIHESLAFNLNMF